MPQLNNRRDMNTNLKLHFSTLKMIKLSLMSVGMIWVGCICFKTDILTFRTVGVLQIILGIVTLFSGMKSLLDKNPQIIMNETGIIDKRILKKEIPWTQIEKIELAFVTNQKVLKLKVSNKFRNDNFKWLYAKTAVVKLNQNPKTVLLNLDQLKFESEVLADFLNSKNTDFINRDVFRNLKGWNKILNKMLY